MRGEGILIRINKDYETVNTFQRLFKKLCTTPAHVGHETAKDIATFRDHI